MKMQQRKTHWLKMVEILNEKNGGIFFFKHEIGIFVFWTDFWEEAKLPLNSTRPSYSSWTTTKHTTLPLELSMQAEPY